jgi:hypothetical protein
VPRVATTDDVLLATVRDFADRTRAARVVILLDRGPDHPAPTIETAHGEPLTITQGQARVLIEPVDLLGVEPLHVHLPVAVPATALEVDVERGELEAPIGLLSALADGVSGLADALGGRSVAQAEFGTRSGARLTLTARPGEPIVVGVGDAQFELPDAGA